VPNFQEIQFHVCVLWQWAKRRKRKKKWRKWVTFWRLIVQEWLVQFTSDLVCILSRYASACTANLVSFGQETTELQTRVNHALFFMLICSHCARMPRFLGPHKCVLILNEYNSVRPCLYWKVVFSILNGLVGRGKKQAIASHLTTCS